jgi:enoyl-CoA hydratase
VSDATADNSVADDSVLFESRGALRRITLNRPRALNALSLAQIRIIDPMLRQWATDPAVAAVVIDGAGEKAFCAGGDIRALYEASLAGDRVALATFFAAEYRLNRRIKTFPKPYVALLDGITMGGGVGLSVHGRYRVATERTLFAMPETGIGMFPDVGGTFFLPRCPGRLGLFLGLTGTRLRTADALYAGIATHVVPADGQRDLIEALSGVPAGPQAGARVGAILDDAHTDPGPAPLAGLRARIDRLFAATTVPEVLAALAADPDPWAATILETLGRMSPTAMAVTARQIALGATLAFDDAMALEYIMAPNVALSHDFREGVRSVIVDKCGQPRWNPARVDDIQNADIEAFFRGQAGQSLSFD